MSYFEFFSLFNRKKVNKGEEMSQLRNTTLAIHSLVIYRIFTTSRLETIPHAIMKHSCNTQNLMEIFHN